MEHMARLGLIEQYVRDSDKFNTVLYEMLQVIDKILQNPYDYELRIVKSDTLRGILQCEAFTDYVKHIGFQLDNNELKYPKEQTLSNLRIAQAAIERKIFFCNGTFSRCDLTVNKKKPLPIAKKEKLTPSYVLKTNNNFIMKIQTLFNDVLKYEDEELQQLAREHIPLVTLQLMAVDRMREHQRMLKAGEISGVDMPFDTAQLLELMAWFKYEFFTWLDTPPCERCGGPTQLTGTTTTTTDTETCRLEVYGCGACGRAGGARFPRLNDPRALLRTRRGRCGEWANCFALLCRALGYDTRYVYDTTDHVWCEVFDYDTNTWVHVDPCENKMNTPLMYSHGWGKQLAYVVAVSRDDLQDVTWRYTTAHRQVLKRRSLCEEGELIACVMRLREHRQRQVSEARRRYLARRTLQELVQLMVEREPSFYEAQGRVSGDREWRLGRGELGAGAGAEAGAGAGEGHTFRFTEAGSHAVRYCAATDRYAVCSGGEPVGALGSWAAGAHTAAHVFRKVEHDWRMVYIARKEGAPIGTISWKLVAEGDDLWFESLSVRAVAAVYETGNVDWTLRFDDGDALRVKLSDSSTLFKQQFKEAVLTATLSGGRADVAWQHAQLFRQPADSTASTLELQVEVASRRD